MEIGKVLGIEVPFSVIFKAPTILAMTAALQQIVDGGITEQSITVDDPVLQADATPHLPPSLPSKSAVVPPQHVLLTGAPLHRDLVHSRC